MSEKGTLSRPTLAVVYSPTGHALGTLSTDRLQILQDAYLQAGQPMEQFPATVAGLLHRYKTGVVDMQNGKQVDMKNHWATCPRLMQLLRTHLHITQERFASPLNRCSDIPHYYTAHQADAAFGAKYDAYSTIWTGSSQANPEYEHEDMDKAVRWAVHCALQASLPTLTTFVLPHWGENVTYC